MKLLEKRKILPSPAKRILRWIIPVLLLGLLYLVYRFPSLLISEKGADYYCRHIFGKVSFVGNMLSNMVFYSITENIVIIGGAALLILIFVLIIKFLLRLLRGGRRRISGIIFMTVTSVLIIGVIMMTDFQLMHGINYLRTPVAVTLGINTGSKRSYDEYCEALKWAYEGMISSRQRLGTDYNGVAHMSTSYGESVIDANALLNSMSAKYDLGLSENYINAKPVSLSHYWSYMGINGYYSMLIGEANINTDYIDITEFPVTLCHEISHAKGYARENDAQTLAILSCIHSPRADFRYAGFIYVFNELYAITYQYAKAYDYDMPSFIDYDLLVDVDRDLVASEMYDQSLADNIYTRLVEKFSRKANDVFLKANGQEDGVESYNVPSSIFLEFYFKHVKAETDA